MSLFHASYRRALGLIAMALLVGLAGCSNSGRRGPPGGKEGPPDRQGGLARQSGGGGMSAQPLAVFIAGLDADADMIVTRDEVQLGVAIAWEAIGQPEGLRALGYADWQQTAFGGVQAHPAYVAFDNDFDGRISQDEFLDLFDREFVRLDADGNGALVRSELITRQRAQQAGRNMNSRPQGGGPGGSPGEGPPPGR